MIIGVIGGIGSGKSVYATKKIVESPFHNFINFNVVSPNVTRIKKDHIVKSEVIGQKKNGKDIIENSVNFSYWNKIF